MSFYLVLYLNGNLYYSGASFSECSAIYKTNVGIIGNFFWGCDATSLKKCATELQNCFSFNFCNSDAVIVTCLHPIEPFNGCYVCHYRCLLHYSIEGLAWSLASSYIIKQTEQCHDVTRIGQFIWYIKKDLHLLEVSIHDGRRSSRWK